MPLERTIDIYTIICTIRYIGKRVHGHTDTDRRTRTRTGGHGHGQLWRRRTAMEKTDSYGEDGQLWKRRALMKKTDTYGRDGHLWKRRGHKAFETNFLSLKKIISAATI